MIINNETLIAMVKAMQESAFTPVGVIFLRGSPPNVELTVYWQEHFSLESRAIVIGAMPMIKDLGMPLIEEGIVEPDKTKEN